MLGMGMGRFMEGDQSRLSEKALLLLQQADITSKPSKHLGEQLSKQRQQLPQKS